MRKYVDYNIFLMRFINETCHCWVLQMADTKIFIILHLLYEKGLNKLSISFNFAQISISLWFCWSHLSHWAWNKGYHKYRKICFIPWHTPRNWKWGRLRTKLYDKRDDLNFPILNLLYVATFQQHLHMEYYMSQLIRYSRACGSYQDFLDRGLLLIRKLLSQRVPSG